MTEKAKISSIQLFLLFTGFLYGSTVILSPAVSAKNDAWMAVILGGASGYLLIWMYVKISLLNPSKTLVDILVDKFGKLAGKLVALMYVWYFIHLASLIFRNFGEFMTVVTFPETPMPVIIGIFALLLVYSINSGIEVISRLSEIFVPFLPIIAVIISLSLITTHDFTAFLPFLERGIKPVLNAALGLVTFPYGEAIAFLMVFPHLNQKENLKNITGLSVLVIVILCLFTFFNCISVLGSDLMYRGMFTPHLNAALIPTVNVEPLIDISLLIGGGTKISVCIYAATRALSQVFGINDYRKLTIAVTTFCVVLSVWVYENILEMVYWAQKVWLYYSIPFQMVIPLVLLLLSWKKKTNH